MNMPLEVLLPVGGLALLLLLIAARISSGWKQAVLRDLGMGLFVALTVALLFELQERTRYSRMTIGGVLDATMGQFAPPEIWLDVRDLVTRRTQLRRNGEIRMRLAYDEALLKGQAKLRVEYQYELLGQRITPTPGIISHELRLPPRLTQTVKTLFAVR